MLKKLSQWFGPVATSIKGSINVVELVRILTTAVASGGGLLAILSALGTTTTWIAAPELATLVGGIVAIVEMVRRMNQGKVVPK